MRFILSTLGGILLALLGLEAVMQALPVASGVRMQETSDASPYARYLPRQPYLYAYGWALDNLQRGVTNQQGFLNSPDFGADANALVIGDSFIESFMLEYPDTVQGRLNAAMGKVYASGASGNGLADALQLSREFLPRTHAKTVILFVEPYDLRAIALPTGRGHNHFVINGNDVKVEHLPYIESKMKTLVLHSALLRYAYYNLKVPDLFGGKRPAAAPIVSAREQALHVQQRSAALNFFLTQLEGLQRQYGTRFVFLVDGDRKAIYANGKGEPNWGAGDREALLSSVRAKGFAVVDMQPVFERHWATYRERMDFLPMDGHWNKVAHQLAAEQLIPLVGADVTAASPAVRGAHRAGAD